MKYLITLLFLWAAAASGQPAYPIVAKPDTALINRLDRVVAGKVANDSLLATKADTAIVMPKTVINSGFLNRYTKLQMDSINAIRRAFNDSAYANKATVAGTFSAYSTTAQANSVYQGKGTYIVPTDTGYLHNLAAGKIDSVVAKNSFQSKGSYLIPADTNYLHGQGVASASWIAANSTVVAGKLNITDTTGMLTPYARKNTVVKYTDTVGNYALYKGNTGAAGPQGVQGIQGIQGNPGSNATATDTTSLSTRINARVKYTDTAAMLSPYARTAQLSPYLTTATATTTYQPLLGYTPYNSTNPSNYVTAATAPVTSVNTRTGAIAITSSDVTAGLGFTPADAASSSATLYKQNNYNIVVNTAAETSAIGTGKGSGSLTLPANFWTVGKKITVPLKGTYQTPMLPGMVTVKVKLGSVTVASVNIAASILAAGSVTNSLYGEATITCYSTGTSGTVVCNGYVTFQTGIAATVVVPFSTASTNSSVIATATINTTVSGLFDVTETWSTASTTQGTTITEVVMVAN